MAEAGPGDFIYVPPYVPHQEINASDDEPLSCVLVRSGQEPVVVNLDIPVVEKPEEVHWVDNIHPAAGGHANGCCERSAAIARRKGRGAPRRCFAVPRCRRPAYCLCVLDLLAQRRAAASTRELELVARERR